jgi:uracil-DNA glycosylase
MPLPPAWSEALDASGHAALRRAEAHIEARTRLGVSVYPPPALRYHALDCVPPDAVKVLILGQDPYHGAGQAMGFAFSVPRTEKIPPSLRNIYKELDTDLGIARARHGDLSHWAQQGVLLLNTALSVEDGHPATHADIGWQTVTDQLIDYIAQHAAPSVFLLWGNHARSKAPRINATRHAVLQSAHPSPLSARKFLGCRHFSQANAFLSAHQRAPIDWQLPDY